MTESHVGRQPVAARELAALLLLLAAAAALRLVDLGGLGFWGPEDYVALAARGILEEGLPVLPSGALYPRALPYSYLVAGSVALLWARPAGPSSAR